MLNNLQIDPATEVNLDGKTIPIRQALVENFELTQCYPRFIEGYAAISREKALADIARDTRSLREFMINHQVFELARKYPATVSAEQFIGCLRKLTPVDTQLPQVRQKWAIRFIWLWHYSITKLMTTTILVVLQAT